MSEEQTMTDALFRELTSSEPMQGYYIIATGLSEVWGGRFNMQHNATERVPQGFDVWQRDKDGNWKKIGRRERNK